MHLSSSERLNTSWFNFGKKKKREAKLATSIYTLISGPSVMCTFFCFPSNIKFFCFATTVATEQQENYRTRELHNIKNKRAMEKATNMPHHNPYTQFPMRPGGHGNLAISWCVWWLMRPMYTPSWEYHFTKLVSAAGGTIPLHTNTSPQTYTHTHTHCARTLFCVSIAMFA